MDILNADGFKQALIKTIEYYVNEENLSLEIVYYIYKDVYNDLMKNYDNTLRRALEKSKKEESEMTEDTETESEEQKSEVEE
jgi:TRAP-type C4-dicarboxylate transport system substrate-binding protein